MVIKDVLAVVLLATVLFCALPVTAAVIIINPGDSIQQAVSGALDGDEIVLNPGTYSENGITITAKNLTFRAAAGFSPADTVIDGKSTAPRIFTVTDASSLTIENLTLRNGRAGDGAHGSEGHWFSDAGPGSAGGFGGAIFSGGQVIIISSTITGSFAGNGGDGGDGGWISGDGGNGGAGGSGGAIYSAGPVAITSTVIEGCSAGRGGNAGIGGDFGNDGTFGTSGDGGAICSLSTVALTSTLISGSSAGNGGEGAYSGGTNGNGGNGGAIYSAGPVTLTSSAIEECSAGDGARGGYGTAGSGGNGGGIFSAGTVVLASSDIMATAAGDGGGAQDSWGTGGTGGNGGGIFSTGPVTLVTSTISFTSAGTGGFGGADDTGGSGGSGGAIFATDTVTLNDATLFGCSAGDGGDVGGGDGGDRATAGSGGNGGAVWAPTVLLNDTTLTGCSAGTGGWGGTNQGWAADGNHAGNGGGGGAVYSPGAVSLNSSTISLCMAGNGGTGGDGGSAADGGNGGNGGDGGAIQATGTVSLLSSTISDCSAGAAGRAGSGGGNSAGTPGNGGAIFTNSAASATSSTFTGCRAAFGSAIYGTGGQVHFCRLTGNDGTTIYSSGSAFDATLNWWGINSDPAAKVNNVVTSSPWLVLNGSATPNGIAKNMPSVIEATLTYDSEGSWHDPTLGHVPDGIPAAFAVTAGPGTVSPASAVTAGGAAQAVFSSPVVGSATVTVTVDGQPVSFTIRIEPEARFMVVDRAVVRQQHAVQFIDQSVSTLPLTYRWDFGDGTISMKQNPVHVYKKEGVYDITLTVTNAFGTDTLTKEAYIFVTPQNPIHANFVAASKERSAPLTVTFYDTSFINAKIPTYPPLNSWSWDFGDGTTSHQQNPTHTYQKAGTYHVTLTVGNSLDAASKTKDFMTVKIPVPASQSTTGPKKVHIKLN